MPSIVNISPAAYSNGAVVFDTPPYLAMIERARQRQEAKRMAADNFYTEMGKGLTPAGMAANDVQDFTDRVGAWRNFVTKNRGVLGNPNDKGYANAVTQADYLYNDALQLSSASKAKVKDIADSRQYIKPDHPLTDSSIMMMHEGTLPVTKGYKPLDFSAFQYKPKEDPTTAEDWTKWGTYAWNGLQMDEGQPNIQVLPDKKSKVVTTVSSYSPSSINTMHDRAVQLYHTDPKFYNSVNKLMQDEEELKKANAKFKEVYKKDIQHPEEFAAALLLKPTTKTNTQPYAYSPTTINVKVDKEDKKEEEIATSIDGYINQLRKNSIPSPYKYKNGTTATHYVMQPSPELSNMFAIKQGSSTIYPDQIQFLPNGDVKPIFYKTVQNKGGDIEYAKGEGGYAVDRELSRVVSHNDFRVRVAKELLGQTGAKIEMKNQTQNAPSKSQEKSYKYNGKTYTTEQLTNAAKESGMSLDDYLKQLGLK